MVDIRVEVRPLDGGDLSQPNLPELLANRIDEIGDSLRQIAAQVAHRLKDLAAISDSAWPLEGVELKFSLDLEAEAGVVIARSSVTAGFEATLTWKGKQP
jgi:Trypsin-co-occurring domain 1